MAYYNPYVSLIDQANAGPLGGAAAGFMTGGPIGAAVGGITGMLGRRRAFGQLSDSVRAIQSPDTVDVDEYGKPVFNSASAIEATQTMNELNSASRRKRRGLRGLFASNDDRILAHGMSMKANMINNGLQSERDSFNSQMMDYNNQQMALQQYNQLLNNQNRFNNLYNIGTSLY